MATFKDIEKANSTIKTTPIKGKDYAEVNQRIKAFRMLYPDGFIRTNIIDSDLNAGIVMMQAVAGYYDENGSEKVLGSGTSFEWKNDPKSMVNKTSYIENCETSAVGRALGMIGLGIDVAIASAEEVKYAVAHQQEPEARPPQIKCERCGNVISAHGSATVNQVAAATKKQFGKVMCWDCGHQVKEELEAKKNSEKKIPVADVPLEVVDADEALQLPFPIED